MRVVRSTAVILFLAYVMLISTVPHVLAATVYTARENGTVTDAFLVGDKIRVIADGVAPFTVKLYDPLGVVRYTYVSYSHYDKILSGYTDTPGVWTVTIVEKGGKIPLSEIGQESIATTHRYTTAVQNVIPETPLGTISIALTLASALSLGIFRSRRRKP